jgi:transcriptional regulator with XRE-family HTH domain
MNRCGQRRKRSELCQWLSRKSSVLAAHEKNGSFIVLVVDGCAGPHQDGDTVVAMGAGIESLSRNLRRLRTERGMSIGDLAKLAGVAKGTLSKLEAGSGNPTVDTVWSIADALGVGMGDLLTEPVTQMQVIRPGDTVWLSSREIAGRVVDRIACRGTVEVWEARFLQGQPFRTDHVPGRVSGTHEHWFVRSGKLELGPEDGEKVELGPGEYVTFTIDRPFVFQAPDGDVDLIMLVSYPRDDPPGTTALRR